MKRVTAIVLGMFMVTVTPSASGAGVLVETIKSHVENRPTLRDRGGDRAVQPEERTQASHHAIPANPLEAYLSRLLEGIVGK